MKRVLLLIFYPLVFCYFAQAQLPPQLPEYELKFTDEFDSVFTTMVDTSKWSRIPDWNQSSNQTRNLAGSIYSCFPSIDTVLWDRAYIIMDVIDTTCTKVENGVCKLKTNREFYQGEVWNWPACDSLTGLSLEGEPCDGACGSALGDTIGHCFVRDTLLFKYTTGMLYSKSRFKYGYFEMKFKLPPLPTPPFTYQGLGPNFWLFAADPVNRNNYWSEIDIFEINGFDVIHGDTSRLTSTIHYSNKDTLAHPNYTNDIGNITNNVWHTAAAWWTPEFIKIYFDSAEIMSFYSDTVFPVDSLIEMPIFIDINSPTINYCINFDSTTSQLPYTFEIDYVRVYQLKQACDTDKVYCNVNVAGFKSKLYQSLTIGGTGCSAALTAGKISGLGNDFVLLEEGVSLDQSMTGTFDVIPCYTGQYYQRPASPSSPPSPPKSWLRKYGQTEF